eukprot:4988901-Pleurochrysis_carterae.AAC.1
MLTIGSRADLSDEYGRVRAEGSLRRARACCVRRLQAVPTTRTSRSTLSWLPSWRVSTGCRRRRWRWRWSDFASRLSTRTSAVSRSSSTRQRPRCRLWRGSRADFGACAL